MAKKRSVSDGARLLKQYILQNCDAIYARAADQITKKTGLASSRASVWHWAKGICLPSAQARIAMAKWADIPVDAWDRE